MAKYKDLFNQSNIRQADLLKHLNDIDAKVDKSLLSKIVNHVVLPTKQQLEAICKFLKCHVLDIYERKEIDLVSISSNIAIKPKKAKHRNVHNLHVEIDKKTANRIINPAALKKLGIVSMSEYIRDCIYQLAKKLDRIEENEKASNAATSEADT